MLIIIAVAQDAREGVFHHSVIKGVEREVPVIMPPPHTVRIVGLPLHTPPSTAVALIRKQLGPSEKMDILKLCCHGNFGTVFLGGLNDFKNALMHDNASVFAPLRDCFHPYQRMIHIHGCAVASETSVVPPATRGTFTGKPDGGGLVFMNELAMWTGCAVQGNIDAIWFGVYFFGDTVLAYPNGKFCTLKGSGIAQLQ